MADVLGAGLPLVDDAADPAAVLADLLSAGHGDGLPVLPPTSDRLNRMLAGMADRDRTRGQVPPLFGELTPRAVAWHAVLAGCVPGELPVVLAAVCAALDPAFNLLGIQTTTGSPAVAVLVHGPIAADLGVTAGSNCLGPGNRANACIGRAVSLALAGIGGARVGLTDMATTGQPAKYTCCAAEFASSPFPSLAVRRGFAPQDSAVTVLGISGTAEVLPYEGFQSVESVLRPAAGAMAASAMAAGDPSRAARGEQFLLLPPELADYIAGRGWDVDRAARFLFDEGCALLREGTERSGRTTSAAAGLRIAASPGDVHVVVAGGPGIKMLLLPTWNGGTRSVTVPVEAVAVPTPTTTRTPTGDGG